MNDLREAVATAIADALPEMSYDGEVDQWYYPALGAGTWPIADAAIDAARPIIEQEVIERLINDTAWMTGWARNPEQHQRMSDTQKTIIDWLSSHLPKDTHAPADPR